MQGELTQQDVKKIINSLIKFIVIDSKEYIANKHKKTYTLHYLKTLMQITNNKVTLSEKDYILVETILNDIEKNV